METVVQERSHRSSEGEEKKTGESTEADHEQPSPPARSMIEKLRPTGESTEADHEQPSPPARSMTEKLRPTGESTEAADHEQPSPPARSMIGKLRPTGESTEADHEQPSPLARAMIEKLRPYGHRAGHFDSYRSSSIYRAPPNIRRGNPAAYEPQILSIGPYHHGNPRLRAMEEHKWRYLHKLLTRRPQCGDCSKMLEVCIEKVRRSEARARRHYSEPLHLRSDDFAKMMVLDACFVLELCLVCYDGREEDDPIFAVAWMPPLMWCDLFKLENQIPFFILEELFSLAAGPSVADLSLRELVFSYLMLRRSQARSFLLGISAETSFTLTGDREIYHLLHFYTLVLLPTAENTGSSISPRPSSSAKSILEKMKPFISSSCTLPISDREEPTEGSHYRRIPGFGELKEAGIECRRKTEATTFLDVTFRNGMLDIPRFTWDNSSDSIARNVLAFEQCCPNAGDHFAAYNFFVASIASTAKDVALLQQLGIVENRLASDEDAALLLKHIRDEVTIRNREHYLAKLFREVNKHCDSKWYQHRAWLKRSYFRHPWASVSVVAATALLLMTLLQVVYVVLSYYK